MPTTRARGRLRKLLDDRKLGRAMLVGLEGFLDGFSPPFVVLVGLLLQALIGLVDAVTGSFAVAVFYLVPVGLVTYARGRWVGTIMAATAATAFLSVDLGTGVTHVEQAVTYWNWLTRFYVYEAVVILIGPMRDVVRWEREVAAREAEAAEKLRALNELRAALESDEEGRVTKVETVYELLQAKTRAEIEAATRP